MQAVHTANMMGPVDWIAQRCSSIREADDANAGIGIVRDALLAVQQKFPSVSVADIWGL